MQLMYGRTCSVTILHDQKKNMKQSINAIDIRNVRNGVANFIYGSLVLDANSFH